MNIGKWITLTLFIHLVGAFSVASLTMGGHALFAGAFFSVLGVFYLVIEFPCVFVGMWLLRRTNSVLSKFLVSIFLYGISLCIGYFMCFKEGGIKPADYLSGFVLGSFLGCSIVIGEYLLELKRNNREQGSAHQSTTAP